MKIAIILSLSWVMIHVFKKLGMEQLPNGLLSGLLSSILVNVAYLLLGEPLVSAVLYIIGFTTLAIVWGFFMSRKIYGLPGIFEDAE